MSGEISSEEMEQLVIATAEKFQKGQTKEAIIEEYVHAGMERDFAEKFVGAIECLEEFDDSDFNIANYLLGMFIGYPIMASIGIFLFFVMAEIAGYRLIKGGVKCIQKGGGNRIVGICGIIEGVILFLAGLYFDLAAIVQ